MNLLRHCRAACLGVGLACSPSSRVESQKGKKIPQFPVPTSGEAAESWVPTIAYIQSPYTSVGSRTRLLLHTEGLALPGSGKL